MLFAAGVLLGFVAGAFATIIAAWHWGNPYGSANWKPEP